MCSTKGLASHDVPEPVSKSNDLRDHLATHMHCRKAQSSCIQIVYRTSQASKSGILLHLHSLRSSSIATKAKIPDMATGCLRSCAVLTTPH